MRLSRFVLCALTTHIKFTSEIPKTTPLLVALSVMDPATAATIMKIIQAELAKKQRQEEEQQRQRANYLGQQPLYQPHVSPAVSSAFATTTDDLLSRSSSMSSSVSSAYCTTPRSNPSPPPECPPRPRKKTLRDVLQDEEESQFDDLEASSDDEEEMTPAEQLRNDRREIIRPVLEFFDKRWLSPLNSPLFKHQYKKLPNPDGTFSLKKNEELVLKLWAKLIRICLRKIMGSAFINDPALVARLRQAARKIVCKRRSNHKFSWKQFGRHKELIYGDGNGPLSCLRSHRPTKLPRKLHRKKFTSKRKLNMTTAASNYDPCCPVDVAPPDMDADLPPDNDCCSDDTMVYDEERPPATSNSAPPVSTLHDNKTQCIDCGKKVTYKSCFPQDHDDWAPNIKKKVRCGDCWDKYVQDQVMPEMDERIKKQASKVTNKKDNDDDGKVDEAPAKKRTRKKRTQCKCGSKTHLTTASLDCPLNKRNLRKKSTDDAEGTIPTDEAPPVTPVDNVITPTADGATPDTPVDTTPSPPDGAPPSTPVAAAPVINTTPTIPTFSPQVGDNVYARWKRNMWYLAHVTHHVGDKYTVYYVEDSKVKNLTLVDLRPAPLTASGLGSMTRSMLVHQNVEWWFDGADDLDEGHWIVRSIGPKNTFVCVRRTGGSASSQNVEKFDIGYVMRTIRDARERVRQR